MTTHDRDKVIAAAREAGTYIDDDIDGNPTIEVIPESCWEKFYITAFEAGRQAEREECVDIYKSLFNLYLDRGYPEQQMAFLIAALDDFIEAIRARGEVK